MYETIKASNDAQPHFRPRHREKETMMLQNTNSPRPMAPHLGAQLQLKTVKQGYNAAPEINQKKATIQEPGTDDAMH